MNSKMLSFLLITLFLAGNLNAQSEKKVIDKPSFILYFDSIPNGGTCLKTNTTLSLRTTVDPKKLSDFAITAVEMWTEKSKACTIVYGAELSSNMKLALQAAQSGDEVVFVAKAVNSEKVVIQVAGKFTVM